MINGVKYTVRGRETLLVSLNNQVGAVYTADVTLSLPSAPPDGYKYSFNVVGNGSTMWAGTITKTDTASPTVRIVGASGYQNRQVFIDWELV